MVLRELKNWSSFYICLTPSEGPNRMLGLPGGLRLTWSWPGSADCHKYLRIRNLGGSGVTIIRSTWPTGTKLKAEMLRFTAEKEFIDKAAKRGDWKTRLRSACWKVVVGLGYLWDEQGGLRRGKRWGNWRSAQVHPGYVFLRSQNGGAERDWRVEFPGPLTSPGQSEDACTGPVLASVVPTCPSRPALDKSWLQVSVYQLSCVKIRRYAIKEKKKKEKQPN